MVRRWFALFTLGAVVAAGAAACAADEGELHPQPLPPGSETGGKSPDQGGSLDGEKPPQNGAESSDASAAGDAGDGGEDR